MSVAYVPGQWRRYARPAAAVFVGTAALGFVRGVRGNTNDRARKRQQELLRSTGFVGGYAELGHAVAYELRARGYHPSVASYGGHLCAVGGAYNFQGNRRLGKHMQRSLRSAQRYRAHLEAAGLLTSGTIEAGDMLEGMRAPVSRAQVVRDLAALRALAIARPAPPPPPRPRPKPKSGPSAAKMPRVEVVERLTPDQLASGIAIWAAANPLPPRTPPRPSADPVRERPIDPKEIDRWDADTESLEQYLEWLNRPPDPPD